MNNQTISITYANVTEKNLYIRQLEEVSDTMDISEVADLVDEMFGYEPCSTSQSADSFAGQAASEGTEETQEGDKLTETESLVNQADQGFLERQKAFLKNRYTLTAFAQLVSMGASINCASYRRQPVTLEFGVHRTHENIQYKLSSSTGTIFGKTVVEENISLSLEIEGASYVHLEWFVAGSFNADWATSGPNITRNASTLSWNGNHTGILNVSFTTRYDQYQITIPGKVSSESDDLDYSSTILCFWENRVTTEALNAPTVDPNLAETFTPICESFDDGGGINFHVAQGDVDCYNKIRESLLHPCTNEVIIELEDYLSPIDCPTDRRIVGNVPGGGGRPYAILGTIEIETYINSNSPYWTYDGYLEEKDKEEYDLDFFIEKCCTDIPGPPRCMEYWGTYWGDGIKPSQEYYVNKYPNTAITFTPLLPGGDGSCGTVSSKHVVRAKNCCDDPAVVPVFWDPDLQPDVMGDDTYAIFWISGGLPPYTVIAHGEGLYFMDKGKEVNKMETWDKRVILYSHDLCGTLSIEVVDACDTTDKYGFRSANGSWVQLEYRQWDYYDKSPWHENQSCSYEGHPDYGGAPLGDLPTDWETNYASGSSWWTRALHGQYRMTEWGHTTGYVSPYDYEYECDMTSCGTGYRNPEKSCWPPCLPIPAEVIGPDCTPWECLSYVNGEPCCFECGEPGAVWYSKFDKYGVVTCGTRHYFVGQVISARKWEGWSC